MIVRGQEVQNGNTRRYLVGTLSNTPLWLLGKKVTLGDLDWPEYKRTLSGRKKNAYQGGCDVSAGFNAAHLDEAFACLVQSLGNDGSCLSFAFCSNDGGLSFLLGLR
jgi:hypothetical protein